MCQTGEEPKEGETREDKDEGEDAQEEGKAAAFTVLLHGALKVGGMVAIVQVG